jgi:uncharacterized membrane protein
MGRAISYKGLYSTQADLVLLNLMSLETSEPKIAYRKNSLKSPYLPLAILIGLMVGYIAAIMLLHVIRLNKFYYGFDLAFYQQAIWNTLNGRFLEVSATDFSSSLLGTDAIFIVLLMCPFYAIFPSVYTLLAFETVVVALGAIPVYWFASAKLKNKWVGVGMALVYLLTLSVVNGNLYELRFRPMVTTFLLFAFWYYENKKLTWFAVFAVLALMCRPENGVLIALMGVYGWLTGKIETKQSVLNGSNSDIPPLPNPPRVLPQGERELKSHPYRNGWLFRRRLIIVPAVLGIVWLIVTVGIIIPGNAKGSFALGVNYPGGSPVAAAFGLVTNPVKGLNDFFGNGEWFYGSSSKILYIPGLLLPFLFLPLLSPAVLLMTLPPIVLNLLSIRPIQWNAYNYHYQGSIVPFLIVGTIYALAKYLPPEEPGGKKAKKKKKPTNRAILGVYAVIAATVLLFIFGPNQAIPSITRREEIRWQEGRALIAKIPADAPLAISSLWAASVPPRQGLWVLLNRVLYSTNPTAKAQYIFANLRNQEEADIVLFIRTDPNWEEVGQGGEYILLKRK